MTSRVAVAAPNAAAGRAALRVVAEGGGAVDAAVAATMVTMVTEPGIVSLAGGAFVTVWPAGDGDAVTLDGAVAVPGLGRDPRLPVQVLEVDTAYGGGVSMTVGPGSVAVPGAPAALDLAQSRYGTLPWREVVLPAREVARDGFPLGSASGYYLPYVRDTAFGWDPETARALQADDGRWLETGDLMVVDGLADTVGLIAEEGARTLYDGELAGRLVADLASRGGLVTAEDLSAYRVERRRALAVSTGEWQLRTNPAPSIGGPALAAMLHLLGRSTGAVQVADLVAVQREVLALRRHRLDTESSSSGRTAAARALLGAVAGRGSDGSGRGSASTAHVSVVDSDGTACSITTSYGYGSGATLTGTGLWLNNCLGEHELLRAGRPGPGDRLASNMAPTASRQPCCRCWQGSRTTPSACRRRSTGPGCTCTWTRTAQPGWRPRKTWCSSAGTPAASRCTGTTHGRCTSGVSVPRCATQTVR